MESLTAADPAIAGEFRLRARLGSGGMGRVYLGYSRAGRAVAVKVVHPELSRDTEFLRRFRTEVAAARAVSGLYTAPVVATGLNDNPPWLATTFIAAPNVQETVGGGGPLPEPAVWRLGAGLAEALAAVHACGLVHRDLKPTNVLLADDGPRLIDFGVSRALDGTVLTHSGMTIGTPPFMSPEQAEGKLVDPASDVFSFGSLLCFAACGRPPFGEGSAAAFGVTGEAPVRGPSRGGIGMVVSNPPNLAGYLPPSPRTDRRRAFCHSLTGAGPWRRPAVAPQSRAAAEAGAWIPYAGVCISFASSHRGWPARQSGGMTATAGRHG